MARTPYDPLKEYEFDPDFFPWTSVEKVPATLDWDEDVTNPPDIATPTNVTDARDAILTQGNLAWTTATGFLTSLGTNAPEGWLNAAAFAADAIPATALSAGAVTKMQDGLASQASVNALAADVVKVPKDGMIHHYRNVETEAEATVEISAVD
jgi:hypothetical protein